METFRPWGDCRLPHPQYFADLRDVAVPMVYLKPWVMTACTLFHVERLVWTASLVTLGQAAAANACWIGWIRSRTIQHRDSDFLDPGCAGR